MYDLIIIGAGPAGITASVYAARKRMNFIVLTRDIGGQAAWSGDIENYTGYQFITGPELAKKFEEHMDQYKIPVKEGEAVLSLKKTGDYFEVITGKGTYRSRTVIVSSGKTSKELNVPGEKEFKNKGLSYCATCDGPIFSGKVVAVIGGGNSALDAAIQLSKIASKVYVVNITPALGGDEVMREKVIGDKNTEVVNNNRVLEIIGEKNVKAVKIENINDKKQRVIDVSGIFVEAGLIPSSGFIQEAAKNKNGEISVDCECKTSIDGLFAAGDVTNVKDKQIIIAAGEGAKAALGAFRYLITRKI